MNQTDERSTVSVSTDDLAVSLSIWVKLLPAYLQRDLRHKEQDKRDFAARQVGEILADRFKISGWTVTRKKHGCE